MAKLLYVIGAMVSNLALHIIGGLFLYSLLPFPVFCLVFAAMSMVIWIMYNLTIEEIIWS